MTSQIILVGGYAAPEQPGIHAFGFDASSGALTPRGAFAGLANPSFLALHPNGRWLFSVSETSEPGGAGGGVAALAIDLSGPELACRLINTQPSQGAHPCHLAIDPSGGWLLVSNYSSGSFGALPINPDGSLGPIASFHQHSGTGPNTQRQERAHAHSATFSPDGRFVIVADLGIDQLVVYAFDPASGALTPHGQAQAEPGAGPRHLAFHPSGRTLYAANELGNTVALYDYDAGAGGLTPRGALATLPAGAPESYVADIHIAPDGGRLYVSNRGHNSLAAYDVAADGGLTLAAIEPCGGDWPRNFALAPGGRFALVANQNSGDIAVLPLLDGPAAIGPAVAHAAVPGASFVQFVNA